MSRLSGSIRGGCAGVRSRRPSPTAAWPGATRPPLQRAAHGLRPARPSARTAPGARAPRAPRRGRPGARAAAARPTSGRRGRRRGRVVAALAVQREHVDRPAADPGDRRAGAPSRARGRAPRRSTRPLATSRAARRSASARPARGRSDCSSRRRAAASVPALGRSRSPRALAAAAEPRDDPALDRGRARELDELLADRPGERLEGVRAARARADPGRARSDGADQRVIAEALRNGRRSSSTPSAKRIRAIASSRPRARRRQLPSARRAGPRDRARAARRARRRAGPRRGAGAPGRRRGAAATPSVPRARQAERPARAQLDR